MRPPGEVVTKIALTEASPNRQVSETMTSFTPTAEQQAALDAFATGGSLVIEAGAGSGKTSTLQLLAESKPKARILYLAYNKAIQLDAEKRFPKNVACRTAHSLAYATHGAKMRHRLNAPRVPAFQVAKILGQYDSLSVSGHVLTASSIASLAMRAVEKFCRSTETTITKKHFVAPEGLAELPALPMLRDHVIELAQKAWTDLNSPHGRLKFSHDHYLKQWAISVPRLAYDVILFDEAQDADPCIASVVRAQMTTSQVIMVGDAAQAIYGWRGAIDVLSNTKVDHRTQLSQSFRFGQAIADEANAWLSRVGTTMRLSGDPTRQSTVEPLVQADAVLCRTNGAAIQEVMSAHAGGITVALVGGGKDILSLAQAAEKLQAGQSSGHPELMAFDSWVAVQDYAENDPTGSDLAVTVKLIDAHGARGVIAAIEACVSEDHATLIVSTAHKAKGREWDHVRIAADFREPKLDKETGLRAPISKTEAMLAYVAVTRAKKTLDNGGLAWIHNAEYDGK
jgi:DNA helicase IV